MQQDEKLTRDLSAACSMIVADAGKESPKPCVIKLRMGGMFYGDKKTLEKVLTTYFKGDLLDKKIVDITTTKRKFLLKTIGTNQQEEPSMVAAQAVVADFLNPTATPSEAVALLGAAHDGPCKDRGFTESSLPPAPNVTCDIPHPHKVTSGFPKAGIDHYKLAEKIRDFMAESCFRADVNKYMSFHCMGGAVYDNREQRAFPWSDKPYLLQVQSWWNQSGNASIDAERAREYDKWVHDFRKSIEPYIEGAFINFVDKDLVDNPNTPEGKLELLSYYYGDSLAKLREVKSAYDSKNLFVFGMSIPLE